MPSLLNVCYKLLMLLQCEVLATCVFQFDSRIVKIGNFSSPQYPANYPENSECVYNFIGTDFETLRLTFSEFELEPPYSKGCLTDYVDISSITSSNVKQLIGRFCGKEIPKYIESMHPRAEIKFRTNHIVHHRGFRGQFEFRDERFIPPPTSTPGVKGCGGIETGVGGIVSSPGYPHNFPKDVECVWLIRVDTTQHIYIRILELQLYGSIANCGEAELSIYDGYSSFVINPNILKKYCGDLKYYKNVEEKTQLSYRNRLLIRFKTSVTSDLAANGGARVIGFKLVWTAVTFKLEETQEIVHMMVNTEELNIHSYPQMMPGPSELRPEELYFYNNIPQAKRISINIEQCKHFICKDSQYCVKSISHACEKTPLFCIDNSLVCDGLPNCSEDDMSDEDKCNIPLLAGCGAAVCVGVIGIIVGCMLYKRHVRVKKSVSQTQALTMQLRQLEHSPSFASRQPGNFYPTELRSPIEANCSIHTHYDTVVNNTYGHYRTDV